MLDRFGIVKAQEIVASRETFDKFRSIDELTDVEGIGAVERCIRIVAES
ncbi:MAG: helix-hairpin-helix domain-containing protein [Pseudohongiella sp.]|nr:helix-hairpin-helix domain-containing protein [Gammaproteobacteria bacterium]